MLDFAVGVLITLIGVGLFLFGAIIIYSVRIERVIFSTVSFFGIAVSIAGLYCIANGLLQIDAALNGYR